MRLRLFKRRVIGYPRGQRKRGPPMTRPMLASLSVLLLLSACGNAERTWYNPFGWFGGSQEEQASLMMDVGTPQDPRPLVDQVLSLVVEPYQGGAIVRATGLPPRQGYWEAELIAEPVVDGRITYRFVVIPPAEPTRVSTQQSREIMVATSLSNRQLQALPLADSAISPRHRRSASSPKASRRQPRSAGKLAFARRDGIQIGGRGDQLRATPSFRLGLQQHAQQVGQRRVDLHLLAASGRAWACLPAASPCPPSPPPESRRQSRPCAPRAAAGATGPVPRSVGPGRGQFQQRIVLVDARLRGMLWPWA
jgi:hypothetical protein